MRDRDFDSVASHNRFSNLFRGFRYFDMSWPIIKIKRDGIGVMN